MALPSLRSYKNHIYQIKPNKVVLRKLQQVLRKSLMLLIGLKKLLKSNLII